MSFVSKGSGSSGRLPRSASRVLGGGGSGPGGSEPAGRLEVRGIGRDGEEKGAWCLGQGSKLGERSTPGCPRLDPLCLSLFVVVPVVLPVVVRAVGESRRALSGVPRLAPRALTGPESISVDGP